MTIREMEKGKELHILREISPRFKGSSYYGQSRRFKGGLNSEQVQNFHFQA